MKKAALFIDPLVGYRMTENAQKFDERASLCNHYMTNSILVSKDWLQVWSNDFMLQITLAIILNFCNGLVWKAVSRHTTKNSSWVPLDKNLFSLQYLSFKFQHCHEGFLRYINFTYCLHSLFPFSLHAYKYNKTVQSTSKHPKFEICPTKR